MSVTFPGESAEYRTARDRLLEQEIELRRKMEVVAAARRELPPGGAVPEDYVFEGRGADGQPVEVRMSELFAPGRDSLVIYNFMFPRTYAGERPGACEREHGATAAGGGSLPVLRSPPRSSRRRGRAREPARQPGGGGEDDVATASHLRR